MNETIITTDDLIIENEKKENFPTLEEMINRFTQILRERIEDGRLTKDMLPYKIKLREWKGITITLELDK